MTTAVVIPSYNGLNYLKENLPAVVRLKTDEIIIVDDSSSDGTVEFITGNFPQIRLFQNSCNRRFPYSVNFGFRATKADIVILLNQDATPAPDLLKQTLKYFVNPKLFAVSFNEGKYGWAGVSFKNGFVDYKSFLSHTTHASFWASGGSAAFSKIIWDKLGGLDEIFTPGYFEDLDIGWRARKRGYEILWIPQAKVKHIRETAYNKAFTPRQLQLIKDRNFLICQWKNLDTRNLFFHFIALVKRCLSAPGYITPVLMTKWHFFRILAYRFKNSGELLPDNIVFGYGP